ncbi:MAG: BatA domain-containing protein [Kiritimatiellia bacterium]
MISFLNSAFLWGLAALTIPLILHFIQSSRTERLPFSTIRFLKAAHKRSSRRVKMENFLLMLLRLLLLALLVIAFAMPVIRTTKFGNILGRTSRDVAVVIDGSYSMNYRLSRQVVWDQAKELAVDIIRGLGDNDRFCIYLAGEQLKPVYEQMSGNKEEAVSLLKNLPKPVGSSELCPAVIAALDVLEKDSRRSERELHIISDYQRLPWAGFRRNHESPDDNGILAENNGVGTNVWDPALVSDNTTCFVTLLGTPEPENSAAVDVELAPELITEDTPCRVSVTLSRTAPSMDSAVSIFVDGKEVGRQAAAVEEGRDSKTQFMLPPMSGGVHALRVETPDDALADDNAFYFLIRVREKLPVLCVGEKHNTLFLRTALDAGSEGVSPVDAKTVSPAALAAENFASYSCVFLCDAVNLPGQEIARLERYAASGGLLIVFPGDRAVLSDYSRWSVLPAKPISFIEPPPEDRRHLLTWDRPQHPVLRNLAEDGFAPSLVIKRQLNIPSVEENAESIVSTSAGEPFLATRSHKRGAVMLFSVAADRSWSDFPLSPFYLPLMHQIIRYAAGVGGGRPYIDAADSLSLTEHLPEATRASILTKPDGKQAALRSAMVEGSRVIYAEGLNQPGQYTLQVSGTDTAEPALAVNMPRIESDLTPLEQQDITDILKIPALHVAVGRNDLMKKLEDFRIGRSLGESILWIALLAGILEVFYSNYLMRKNSKLTDLLKLEPSGRVREK